MGATPTGARIQRAWLELEVMQCGYCQPGQIMSAAALLAGTPNPDDSDIDPSPAAWRSPAASASRLPTTAGTTPPACRTSLRTRVSSLAASTWRAPRTARSATPRPGAGICRRTRHPDPVRGDVFAEYHT
ncbi:MAG: 2Fe-2S iron-sulfur cluster-binding protein [Acetobacteraceae bacterium]